VAEQAAWACATAASLLPPLGQRWEHTLGVAERASEFSDLLSLSDLDLLVSAAYLHDIGYAAGPAATGFHPLDGARLLRRVGRERLACLVAHHSGARVEAEERGLLEALERFPEERSLLADALTYCDLTTDAGGAPISVSARLDEIAARYGAHDPVGRAIRRSRGRLVLCAESVERARESVISRSRGRPRAR
jgi:putative nucleotidyltransferase with HDIG domain